MIFRDFFIDDVVADIAKRDVVIPPSHRQSKEQFITANRILSIPILSLFCGYKPNQERQIHKKHNDATFDFTAAAGQNRIAVNRHIKQVRIIFRQRDSSQNDRAHTVPQKMDHDRRDQGTAVIKRLIVMTLSTGRIPASNAPPCANVNKPVDTIIAAAMLPLLFIIWYK